MVRCSPRRPSFSTLAAFVVALALWPAGETAAGPTVKKSRWVTWTRQLTVNSMGFGILFGGIRPQGLKTPVCLPGETPLLMRARVTPAAVSDGSRSIAAEALGTWSAFVSAEDLVNGRVETLEGWARGAESVDLAVEAGVPWSGGNLNVLSRATFGLQPAVRQATFSLEFTLTCGRDDVVLEPMARD
jgi:hypothetical protein